MKTNTNSALIFGLLLATSLSQQSYIFGQKPHLQKQEKTFQQYFTEQFDKDPQVKSKADVALKKMALEAQSYQYTTVQQCIKHLKNKNGYVRMWAVEALGEMGPKAKDAIPSLLEAMHEDGQCSEFHVFKTLEKIEPQLDSALHEIIINQKASRNARQSAVRVLWQSEPHSKKTISLLISLLNDKCEDTIVRRNACIALGMNGSNAEQIVSNLMKVFQNRSDNSTVRFHAAMELGRRFKEARGSQKEEIFQVLVEVLKKEDEKPTVRGIAAMILGEVDQDGKRAITIFMETLQKDEQNEYVLGGIIKGLTAIGPAAKEAVPLLKVMLKHKNKDIRKLAAEALKKIETEDQERKDGVKRKDNNTIPISP